MVKTWAEKEMRNLQRMHQAGLPVPKARALKVFELFDSINYN
jgi:serine/threonine-protein kinase RIO1